MHFFQGLVPVAPQSTKENEVSKSILYPKTICKNNNGQRVPCVGDEEENVVIENTNSKCIRLKYIGYLFQKGLRGKNDYFLCFEMFEDVEISQVSF